MRTLEQVWVYVDAAAPAPGALDAAVQTALRTDAALRLIGAIGSAEDRVFRTSLGKEILQMVRADREARLRDLEASALAALPRARVASTLLEAEVPWHAVVAHAVERSPDLVVMPAGVGGGGRFGSVTQHFFRKCPAPVWAVIPGARSSPVRVLAAVEPGVTGSDQRTLARSILDLPLRIAGSGRVELHVATAWTLFGEVAIRARLGPKAAEEYRAAQRDEAQKEVDDLLREAGSKASIAGVHLPNGPAEDAIPALAERLDADLVVLGSAGRTGLAGFLIGSTAEAIIGRLGRSAAVVKPPGYVSPVRARPSSGGAGGAR